MEWAGSSLKTQKKEQPQYPTLRLGADGKVEVKLISAADATLGGSVILDHLPLLGECGRKHRPLYPSLNSMYMYIYNE